MPRSRDSDLHGFVVVDKAAGWSSHDVVARVRKLTGVRRVGHAGTLDPFATGVLVLGVGKATRLLQYIQGSTKVYQATIRLGEETDTLDPEGVIVSRKDVSAWPSADQVTRVIERFIGTIQQVPPAHSAIHIEGKRAYDLARAGQEFDLPTRTVTINGITIRGYDPPRLDLEIVCHTGTYIRSLARDIGRELQTYGYCAVLRRTAIGDFTIENAVDVTRMNGQEIRERWEEFSLPPDRAVQMYPRAEITGKQTVAWYHGQSLPDVPGTPDGDDHSLVRVYSADGAFAGLGTFEEKHGLRPVLVFSTG